MSLLRSPDDAFTIHDPRLATRVSAPGTTCAATGPPGACLRWTNVLELGMVRVHAVAVEGRVGRECHQLLGDEPLRLDQQLVTARLELGVGGLRPDQHTAAASPSIGLTTSSPKWFSTWSRCPRSAQIHVGTCANDGSSPR